LSLRGDQIGFAILSWLVIFLASLPAMVGTLLLFVYAEKIGVNNNPFAALPFLASLALQAWLLFWFLFPALGRVSKRLEKSNDLTDTPLKMRETVIVVFPFLSGAKLSKQQR